MIGPQRKVARKPDRRVTPLAPMMLAQFDAWVAKTPNAVAVIDEKLNRSYSQLDTESRAYARLLRKNNVGRETVVAIVAERGPQYIAMLLGVLRSGAAFMPLEPITPAPRARLMCAKAHTPTILVQPGYESYASDLVCEWENHQRPAIVEARATDSEDARTEAPVERNNAGLAYVIFTSGSTGIPKGAMITDGGMNNHLSAKILDLSLSSCDVIGFTASLSFDISIWQALTALCAGGRVCTASPLNISEPSELAAWVERHAVTVLEIVPSFLAVVLDLLPEKEMRSRFRSLRFMIATGEALPIQLAQRWYEYCPDIPLVNAYGPTECSDDVTHHILTKAECSTKTRSSIGREIINTDVYIIDDNGHETDDVEGELLVGGRGVCRGYIRDPVRTAVAFIPDYLSGRPGQRLYRTGDQASRSEDGSIHYLGRRDRQMKIRGHRVELGDVESELLRVPDVTSAACVLTDDKLRAYVTLRPGSEHPKRQHAILDTLRRSAPAYLIPQEIAVLDRLPTGPSGKIDYRALERLGSTPAAVESITNGDWSGRLTAIREMFAAVLGTATVGEDDDFFMAGGDSLQAMKVVSLARTRFDVQAVPLRGFLLNPTPRGMITLLETAQDSALADDAKPNDVRKGALSFGQERLWLTEQLYPQAGSQLLRLMLTLRGSLDVRALQHALNATATRHEPLRTVFSQEVGVPVGTVWPETEFLLKRIGPDEVPHHLLYNSGLSTRTERPPLAAAQLAEIAPDHYILTVVLHHLVADGWSLAVLGEEISAYYQRWLEGKLNIPLPQHTYSDYVSEERRWLETSEAVECEQYWSNQLAGASRAINLPLDRPHAYQPDFTTNYVLRELSVSETTAVGNLSRTMKATPFMVVMAAFYITLRELTATDDLVVGIDAVNRSWPHSEELIGTFVNQLPVRMSWPSGSPTFREVLILTRRQCLGAYEHERLPFHKIVAAVGAPRRAGRFPLFQVKLTQQGAWRSSLRLPGIQITPAGLSEPMIHWDLLLDVSSELHKLKLELVYRPEILDHDTAEEWVDAIARNLRVGIAQPDSALHIAITSSPSISFSAPTVLPDRIEPRTHTETLVATVWRDVLKLKDLSVTDNFFEVGGHSLAASQVVSELSMRTGIELELEKFFDLESLAEIAAEIDRRKSLIHSHDTSPVYEGEL